jgi:hypothetical protein
VNWTLTARLQPEYASTMTTSRIHNQVSQKAHPLITCTVLSSLALPACHSSSGSFPQPIAIVGPLLWNKRLSITPQRSFHWFCLFQKYCLLNAGRNHLQLTKAIVSLGLQKIRVLISSHCLLEETWQAVLHGLILIWVSPLWVSSGLAQFQFAGLAE